MAISPLEEFANKYRPTELVINRYQSTKNEYSSTNKDAISDGDELGKGENPANGSIGSKTDILTRNTEVVINRYGPTNPYSLVNKDAISDGDEFGKGENPATGSIGSKTDILKRVENTGKNEYSSKKEYNRHPKV